jgi:DNA-directed RNA polymerase specialized sigma24 family protein
MAQNSPDGPRYFPETQWSMVQRAAQGTGVNQRDALVELLTRYSPVLQSYLVYRKRFQTHEAEDLVQGFLLSKVLEQDLIAGARQESGMFRAYLVTALNRYVISQIRHEQALKRGGADGPAALSEHTDLEDQSSADSFDIDWARQLLAQAIDATREECLASDRADVWGIFHARVLEPALTQSEPMSYEELVERFKLVSPAQASNLLITGRRTFVRVLRRLISEYEPDEQRIDAEISDLQTILSHASFPAE